MCACDSGSGLLHAAPLDVAVPIRRVDWRNSSVLVQMTSMVRAGSAPSFTLNCGHAQQHGPTARGMNTRAAHAPQCSHDHAVPGSGRSRSTPGNQQPRVPPTKLSTGAMARPKYRTAAGQWQVEGTVCCLHPCLNAGASQQRPGPIPSPLLTHRLRTSGGLTHAAPAAGRQARRAGRLRPPGPPLPLPSQMPRPQALPPAWGHHTRACPWPRWVCSNRGCPL